MTRPDLIDTRHAPALRGEVILPLHRIAIRRHAEARARHAIRRSELREVAIVLAFGVAPLVAYFAWQFFLRGVL